MEFNAAYNRKKFLDFCTHQFLPEDFSESAESITPTFKTSLAQQITYLGACPSLDLHVYEIKHNSENDPRMTLSKEAFRIMAAHLTKRALVVFSSFNSDNYRLSLITLEFKVLNGSIIKEFSNPRRYSFFLGPQAKLHTPQQFLLKKCV